jgi:hypothetical protein
VGATWDGETQLEKYLRRGHWLLGWGDADQPGQAAIRDKIRKRDRMAIKQMLGRGSSSILIKALGIVEEIDEDKTVWVNWLVKDLHREVSARGCFASVHGPFCESDPWVQDVFHI